MKIYDSPRQARSLREIEAASLEHASRKLSQIHGTIQPTQTTEKVSTEEPTEPQEKKISKKARTKKGSKAV